MFSRPERLILKTSKDGVGRYDFLKQLMNEFQTTKSLHAKQQVIANLANFAYDPVNYKFLASLKVIDLFLDQLSETNIDLIQFAVAGICNIVVDPDHQEYLIRSKGIKAIISCIFSCDERTVLSAVAILIFSMKSSSKNEHITTRVIERLKQLSSSSNIRLSNLAHICIQDYNSCTRQS